MLRSALVLACSVFAGCASTPEDTEKRRKNILILVADDLGYTDLGIFGSEIKTPNLDRLASSGMLMTNFLVSPTCSPTRAMLLTGKDAHLVGLGTMSGCYDERQRGMPGYEGYMTGGVKTIATRLREADYFTCMAGKWHLGTGELSPSGRGFERSFALLPGGASHFADATTLIEHTGPAPYEEDGKPVDLPKDFFSSKNYTDKLIEYTREAKAKDEPFFALATYTAPHWPLHAPEDWIDRYRSVYDDGYEALRKRRFANALRHGVVPAGSAPPEPYRFTKPWSELTPAQRKREARVMEIYAAMVENLDHHIGRLIESLRESGELQHTLILFFPDNGAEGNPIGELAGIGEWVKRSFDNSRQNLGRQNSYCWLSPGWARATAAPFRLFKAFPTQGGVRVPAIVSLPGHKLPKRSDALFTVKDVAPTLMELATDTPAQRSLLRPIHDPDHVMGWELFGRRAIQKGHFKISWVWPPYGSGAWELYDLRHDPAEQRDLAITNPQKLRELLAHWDDYVAQNRVVLPAHDTGYAIERE